VEIEFQSGKVETFDEVILTLPANAASCLCEGLTQEEYDKLKGIQYLGVICASLLLKKPISKFYVTNVTDDHTPFTGIIEMTAMVDPAYFGGKTLIYLPKYIQADHPDFLLTDQQLEDRFWGKLLVMYPHLSEDDLIDFQVSRARNVFALSTLNYSENLPPVSMSVPGIHVLNSAHISNGTLNVNETIQLAEKELPKIIEAAFQRQQPAFAHE
jgi:protoporphyrinogen oxidase